MLIVGLTGSIGMGKSAAAAHLGVRGVPVCDADAVVHELYAGSAAPLIEAAFPGTVNAGVVDRTRLSLALRADPAGFQTLEAIVHPLVRASERSFLSAHAAKGTQIAVLEIPLLFETGADRMVDVTIVVSAPAEVQRERVLQRPGMTPERLESLLSRQMADEEKRRRADFVVDTGGTLAETHGALDAILASLEGRSGTAFERCWA